MNTRQKQKALTRSKLVKSGLKIAGKKGFSAVSIREVTAEAGISPAAFYRHFNGMEELGLAMIDEIGLSLRKLIRNARLKLEPGPKAIDDSVDAFLGYVNNNANLFKLLLGEKQGASSTFRKAIYAEIDRFVSEMAEDLKLTYEKLNRPLRDPGIAAEAIVALVFTLGAEALELPAHKQSGLQLRLVEHVKTILRGSIQK